MIILRPGDHLLRRDWPVLDPHVYDLKLVSAGKNEEDARAPLPASEDPTEPENDNLFIFLNRARRMMSGRQWTQMLFPGQLWECRGGRRGRWWWRGGWRRPSGARWTPGAPPRTAGQRSPPLQLIFMHFIFVGSIIFGRNRFFEKYIFKNLSGPIYIFFLGDTYYLQIFQGQKQKMSAVTTSSIILASSALVSSGVILGILQSLLLCCNQSQ